jgi:CBS domain-containing protein
MKVDELMTAEPVTCDPRESLNQAAQRMWEHDLGCLPVVDDGGKPVGMLTDRDICMASYTRGEHLHGLRVAEAMSGQVVTCGPTDGADMAARRMATAQVRRIPVVGDDGVLRGVLALSDLVHASQHSGSPRVRRTLTDQVVSAMATVCLQRGEPSVRATPPIEEIHASLA